MFFCIYGKTIPESVSLRDFAYCFSPLVEETSSDTAIIDVQGCELLFGSPYELASEISARAARPKELGGLECNVNVALAGNPDTAIYAARFFQGITFISPGEELTCLGELPIGQLCPELKLLNSKSKTGNKDGHEIEEIFETLK